MGTKPNDPRAQRLIKWLDGFEQDLWNNLHRVPELSRSASAEIVGHFLELSCMTQHAGNIQLGRTGILELPRPWIVERIEVIATNVLSLDDEWQYRRLLEVYKELDKGLLLRLVAHGQSSHDDVIKEAAQDFSG